MRHTRSAALNLMALASALMIGGLLLLLLGITGAYFFDHRLTMAGIVAAHSLVILGPTAVKIGYVMRLLAERQERLSGYSAQHI
ncbi:hypothetical protein [Stutzerimonas frequens]|jgi:uncharacterized membrane-anchored protein|uniref:hypothetical protein n=1 Tax=Stutzerimonas frequens TaxID=2968969 RepID=UPI0007B9D3B4|nr:hypothetical protein [Stutzerimonas frequens]KZX64333.1 hypothetical protein A3710_14105 [Stutzerimonas frequens]MDA0424878.1 hypothetical protein [Stutzerimonas frequens]